MFVRPTWAEIDLDKIDHNIQSVRRLLPEQTKLMAVVKANAYGHGAAMVAQQALRSGASYLAVASVDEGIELRGAGITAPILVLGFTPPAHAEAVVRHHLTQTLYQEEMLLALNDAARAANTEAIVHIKVDTGMGRIGFTGSDETVRFIQKALDMPHVTVEGMFSHFATADEEDDSYTREQIERWIDVKNACKKQGINVPIQHISNSAAILQYPECAADMVRLGISMYGYYPSDEVDRTRADIRPALRLVSQIAHLKHVPAGTKISYGATFSTSRPTWIATVPIGYADGYSRQLSNTGHVIVNGVRCPVAGRVCMDQIMIDVTEVPDVKLYDEVVLYGSQGDAEVSLEEVAATIGTITYEVCCALGRRVPRRYLQQGTVIATHTPQ